MSTYHVIDKKLPDLAPRARVTIFESDGITHPHVVDEGLFTEVAPTADADDQQRVMFFVRFPKSSRYVLRWDGGGEATVTGKTLGGAA